MQACVSESAPHVGQVQQSGIVHACNMLSQTPTSVGSRCNPDCAIATEGCRACPSLPHPPFSLPQTSLPHPALPLPHPTLPYPALPYSTLPTLSLLRLTNLDDLNDVRVPKLGEVVQDANLVLHECDVLRLKLALGNHLQTAAHTHAFTQPSSLRELGAESVIQCTHTHTCPRRQQLKTTEHLSVDSHCGHVAESCCGASVAMCNVTAPVVPFEPPRWAPNPPLPLP